MLVIIGFQAQSGPARPRPAARPDALPNWYASTSAIAGRCREHHGRGATRSAAQARSAAPHPVTREEKLAVLVTRPGPFHHPREEFPEMNSDGLWGARAGRC